MRKFRALVATLMIGSVVTMTGCFGKFSLTQKVWNFNNSLGNKFLNTLVFWAFAILPIYDFAILGDTFILNLIEFWTGSNPLAMKDGETIEKVAEVNGKPVKMTFANRGQDVTITTDGKSFTMHVDETSAVLRDDAGQVVSESRQLADGSLQVRNGAGDVVMSKSAGEMVGWASLMRSNADAFVQQLDVERGTRLASAH